MAKEADSEIVRRMEEPARRVLGYDLDSLTRLGRKERLELAGEVMARKNTFERLYSSVLPREDCDRIEGKIATAQLYLAAAEVANGEAGPESSGFTTEEISLPTAFQKYSILDSLPAAELVRRTARDERLRELIAEFSGDGCSRLDEALNSPGIRPLLRLAFSERLKELRDRVERSLPSHRRQEAVSEETAVAPAAGKDDVLRRRQPESSGGAATGRPVSGEDARLSELNFIARFDTKMQSFPLRFYSPVHRRTFVVRSWGEGDHVAEADRGAPDMPWNTRSRYVVRRRIHGTFGEKVPRVVIEAVSFAHIAEYERSGFDSRCADLTDFLFLTGRLIDGAELGKYLHVIGIASPTGWDERVLREIQSAEFARNYVSRFVSICLVDSMTGDVAYSRSDDRISGYIRFFKPEFDSEKIERLRNHIVNRLLAKGYVVLQDTVQECGEPRNLVYKVLCDVEKEGRGKIRSIRDIGIVLQAP